MGGYNSLPQLQPVQVEDPLQQYGRVLAIKQAQQNQAYNQQAQPLQLQAQQQQVQMQQQQLDDDKRLNELWLNSGGDIHKVTSELPNSGVSAKGALRWQQNVATASEQISKMDKEHLDAVKAANSQLGPIAQSILDAAPEDQPALYSLAVNKIKRDPALAKYASDLPAQFPGPEMLQHTIAQMKTFEQLAATHKQQQEDVQFGQNYGPMSLGEIQQLNGARQKTYTVNNPNGALPDEYLLKPGATKADAQRIDTAFKELQSAENTKANRDVAKQRLSVTINGAPGSQLSDPALEQAAEKYFQTGQLPPIGRGASGVVQQRKIMNRAAELHPEGELAGNAAAFKANQQSLAHLQQQFDQVTAFENTAKKNIDLADSLAKRIPDLGSRWANVPIRMINSKMIGDANMAAFNTALQTAQTEAAKVLNSATGAGVLSDSSRKELQDIIDGNLPYKSISRVFKTLKQDMENRNQSYTEQIRDIKDRLKSKPQGGESNVIVVSPEDLK